MGVFTLRAIIVILLFVGLAQARDYPQIVYMLPDSLTHYWGADSAVDGISGSLKCYWKSDSTFFGWGGAYWESPQTPSISELIRGLPPIEGKPQLLIKPFLTTLDIMQELDLMGLFVVQPEPPENE